MDKADDTISAVSPYLFGNGSEHIFKKREGQLVGNTDRVEAPHDMLGRIPLCKVKKIIYCFFMRRSILLKTVRHAGKGKMKIQVSGGLLDGIKVGDKGRIVPGPESKAGYVIGSQRHTAECSAVGIFDVHLALPDPFHKPVCIKGGNVGPSAYGYDVFQW